jgi:Tol biopolymer transport system component
VRGVRLLCSAAAGAMLAACGDSTKPAPLAIPSFVVVGDTGGLSQLYRVSDSVETRLSTTSGSDLDPMSAAGKLVLTSNRDGQSEIYISDTNATVQRRVTNSNAEDAHAALSPDGTTILFVSNRSGAPRIWVVPAPALDATTFDAPAALATGSSSEIPEGAPAWSPDGSVIAFSSTRSGTSQIYTMPVAGGDALELTTDAGGAFSPAWSADGSTIYYLSATGLVHLRRVKSSGGSAVDYATDSLDLDAPSCNATLCISAENPAGDLGSVLAFPAKGGKGQVIIARTHNERQAAILVP